MDFRAILMGLAFALMWSSAFTSARMIVTEAPPLFALMARFFVSGLIGVGLAMALGQGWPKTRAQWRVIVIFGICQNALYLGFNFVAMSRIEASVAAIIASSLPLLVALAGWLFLGERLRGLALAGLGLGFAGVLLIMGARVAGGVDPLGVALCLLGAVALTVATLVMRGVSTGGGVLMTVGLQMLVGAVALVLPVAVLEGGAIEINWSLRLVLAFLYTVLVPGLLATWVWFLLVQRIGTVRASSFHFLNPVFGVAIAALLLGERLGVWDVIGVVVITLGILAVQISRLGPKAAA